MEVTPIQEYHDTRTSRYTQYRWKHVEKMREYQKEYMRKWREAHPEKVRAQYARDKKRRDAKLAQLSGKGIQEEKLPGHCGVCGILVSVRPSQDPGFCKVCYKN